MHRSSSSRLAGLPSRAALSVAVATAMLASVAPAPAAAKGLNATYQIACFLVHNGPFDQGKGAVFFSEIGSVEIVNGMRQGDAEGTFRAKVKATYNVNGAAACTADPDPEKLRAFLADVAGSYKRHKHVQTGFKPLE